MGRTSASTSRRKFPARSLLLDASVLIRFHKCGALQALCGLSRLVIAGQVGTEFKRPFDQRIALEDMAVQSRGVMIGSPEWEEFCRLRGGELSTRDLGEDESIALALADRKKGKILPFAVLDKLAAKRAIEEGVAVLGFLELLAWLVASGKLSVEDADHIEVIASQVNGWKRPSGYPGSIGPLVDGLCDESAAAIAGMAPLKRANQKRK